MCSKLNLFILSSLMGILIQFRGPVRIKGNTTPFIHHIDEFHMWYKANDLLHIPTIGDDFTLSNGRQSLNHIDKRMDRTVYNQAWLDACTTVSYHTLIKNKSDHFPPLFEFNT